jgi:hypothetical protein
MTQRERIADELLVLRSQEGDGEAFEQLVGRWQERRQRGLVEPVMPGEPVRYTGFIEAPSLATKEGDVRTCRHTTIDDSSAGALESPVVAFRPPGPFGARASLSRRNSRVLCDGKERQ